MHFYSWCGFRILILRSQECACFYCPDLWIVMNHLSSHVKICACSVPEWTIWGSVNDIWWSVQYTMPNFEVHHIVVSLNLHIFHYLTICMSIWLALVHLCSTHVYLKSENIIQQCECKYTFEVAMLHTCILNYASKLVCDYLVWKLHACCDYIHRNMLLSCVLLVMHAAAAATPHLVVFMYNASSWWRVLW